MNRAEDFWNRRKAKVQEEAAVEARAAEARAEAVREREAKDRPDDEILAELGLPDPDTLNAGDDFAAFLSRAVPERIRRRALRRLWLSNPALANLDGLLEYGEDYTDSACVIEGMQTAYRVGKGMLAHVHEMARQAEAATEAGGAAPDAPDAPDAPAAEPAPMALTGAEPRIGTEAAPAGAATAPAGTAADKADDPPPLPCRRMTFRFPDQAGETA